MPAETVFPLTPPQEFFTLVDLVKPGAMLGEHNTNAAAFRVTGRFDPDVLQHAIDRTAQRQRVLRGALVEDADGQFAFAVHDVRIELNRHELADVARPGDTERTVATRLSRMPISARRPPLVRIHAVDLGEPGWLVVVALHEIVGDGSSVRALLRDLSRAYRSIDAGEQSPPPGPDYLDYFADRDGPTEKTRAFWQSYLAQMPADSFPTDHPKSDDRRPVLDQVAVVLPAEVLDGVNRLARTTRTTPFMVMLATYSLAVAEKTGATDIVVPTWWSGREDPATEDLIGLFLRVLPIRIVLAAGVPFQDLLTEVRRSAVGAFEHADMPTLSLIAEVPEAAAIFADPEYCWNNFQVTYGATASDFRFAAADSVRVFFQADTDPDDPEPDSDTFSEELHFRIVIEADAIRINAVYDRSLFEPATVSAFTQGFTRLLTKALENPELTLGVLTAG
jgi:hypothetical protein